MKLYSILNKAFLYILTTLLISCGDGKPSGVLPEEKMSAVLWDVIMAGEFANGYVYYQHPSYDRAGINNQLLNEIFRIHDISKKDFDKSLEYYKKHPEILTAVLDSIAVKQTGSRAVINPQDPGLLPNHGTAPPSAMPQQNYMNGNTQDSANRITPSVQ